MEETFKVLTEKMGGDASSYEALQYLQSFVARKKKTLGPSGTSLAVFHGAKALCQRPGGSGPHDAGVALSWFMESEDLFHLCKGTPKGADYCDTDRLLDLLTGISAAQAEPVVSEVYNVLHQVVLKSGLLYGKNADNAVISRMSKLDNLFADVLEQTEMWRMAYKVVLRLGTIPRAASILSRWADGPETYAYEKPLFYARAILTLLADRKIDQAVEMGSVSKTYVTTDNVSPPRPGGDDSGPLSCWHVSIILSQLAQMPPKDRVDKLRLFNVLTGLYVGIMERLDVKLVELLEKVGINVFNYQSQGSQSGPNPMAMLEAMMKTGAPQAGGRGKKGAGGKGQLGGMDVNELMAMMNQMQGR